MKSLRLSRIMLLVPQLLAITLIVFILVQFTPGDRARSQLGSQASAEAIQQLEQELGLDQPLYVQFFKYVQGVLRGDLGTSWMTGQPVIQDILQRAPATLELITVSFIVILVLALALGIAGGFARGRIGAVAEKMSYGYSLMAGSVPDFWFGMIMIFAFYFMIPLAAAPIGQLSKGIEAPDTITGSILVDSVLTGNGTAFISHVDHLLLPMLVLVFINAAPILRMVRSSVGDAMHSGYIKMAVANGLPRRTVIWYVMKSALPPIITLAGVWYTLLIAGAVLTETIFTWGGLGQYAVQSVQNADWAALQGVVLVVAFVSLLVYLLIDVLHRLVDPRVGA